MPPPQKTKSFVLRYHWLQLIPKMFDAWFDGFAVLYFCPNTEYPKWVIWLIFAKYESFCACSDTRWTTVCHYTDRVIQIWHKWVTWLTLPFQWRIPKSNCTISYCTVIFFVLLIIRSRFPIYLYTYRANLPTTYNNCLTNLPLISALFSQNNTKS